MNALPAAAAAHAGPNRDGWVVLVLLAVLLVLVLLLKRRGSP